jgi:hypothetical protein
MRTEQSWQKYFKATNEKKKTIAREKKIKFRQTFRFFINSSSKLWRLIVWAKNRNHKSKEIFKISALTKKNAVEIVLETIEDFAFKTKMLIKTFFQTRQKWICLIYKFSFIAQLLQRRNRAFKRTKSNKLSNVVNQTTLQNLTTFRTKFWKFCAQN